MLDAHFNSIKVQLKPSDFSPYYAFKLFQFHKGTIKTITFDSKEHGIIIFQFHKGTIKTVLTTQFTRPFHYFNSIKVQLKQSSLANLDMAAT